MNKAFFYFVSVIFSVSAFGQDRFVSKEFGFSMLKPERWIKGDNKELLKNLDKYKLSEESRTQFLKENKGSILLTSFYKYNPKHYSGLIPTIQINVRSNATRNFDEFNESITQSAQAFKKAFADFEFETSPTVVEVAGLKSVYFIGIFSMTTQNGESIKVRSRTFGVPLGGYFFQLNFTDGQDTEDSSQLFDQLLRSIEIVE